MNYRQSKKRNRILEIIRNTDSHPTAEWIYQQLKEEIPDLSLGTVYRNLKILLAQGSIQKLPVGEASEHYEAKMTPHYHLICEQCGRIMDFAMPDYSEINQQAEQLSSFQVKRHRIDFYGICGECRKADPNHN